MSLLVGTSPMFCCLKFCDIYYYKEFLGIIYV